MQVFSIYSMINLYFYRRKGIYIFCLCVEFLDLSRRSRLNLNWKYFLERGKITFSQFFGWNTKILFFNIIFLSIARYVSTMSLWVIIFHINFLARLQPPMSSAMTEAEELTFCIMEFKTCLHVKLNKRFDFIRKDCSSVKSKIFGGNATLCILWKSISLDTCYELGDCGIFLSLMWATLIHSCNRSPDGD